MEKPDVTIKDLIEYDYSTVSILEDTRDMALWFKEEDYFAVVDEDLNFAGIITLADLHGQDHRQVIDVQLGKPCVNPNDSIASVAVLMSESGQRFLPVLLLQTFVGVISFLKMQTVVPAISVLFFSVTQSDNDFRLSVSGQWFYRGNRNSNS